MRQRVMIAMALACHPKLLIADEPTTALDVTIQAQILNIIRDLQKRLDMSVIFITHDMSVVAEMADDVVVMWRGQKVEQAPVTEIFATPRHGYTRALLSAVPKLGSMKDVPLPRREPLTIFRYGAPKQIGTLRMQGHGRLYRAAARCRRPDHTLRRQAQPVRPRYPPRACRGECQL